MSLERLTHAFSVQRPWPPMQSFLFLWCPALLMLLIIYLYIELCIHVQTEDVTSTVVHFFNNYEKLNINVLHVLVNYRSQNPEFTWVPNQINFYHGNS